MKTMANYGWVLGGALLVGCSAPAGGDPSSEVYGVSHPPTASSGSGSEAQPASPSGGKYLSIPGADKLRISGFPAAPSSGSVSWSGVHGGTGSDLALAVTADGSGNFYVGGVVEANGDVGCGAHSTTVRAGFVARYDATGACQWATYMDGTDDVYASALAYDSVSGNIFVAGGFTQTMTINGVNKTSAGGYDGFVAEISPGVSSTTIPWVTTFGGTSDEYVFAIAAGAGHVAVGGGFYGTTSFGGASSATSHGDADAFVARYAGATGAYETSWTAGGPTWDAINSLAARPSGTGFAALGVYSGTVTFSDGPHTAVGGYDAFLTKYDATLAAVATRTLGGAGDDAAHSIVVDASDNITAAGYFQSSINLGGGSSLTGSGLYTGYIARYDSTATLTTSNAIDATGGFIPESIANDPKVSGSMIIAGHYWGSMTFNGTAFPMSGRGEAVVLSLASNGTVSWAGVLGGSDATESLGVAVSSGGKVLAVGDFTKDVTLDTGKVQSSGSNDFFLLCLND